MVRPSLTSISLLWDALINPVYRLSGAMPCPAVVPGHHNSPVHLRPLRRPRESGRAVQSWVSGQEESSVQMKR